MFNNYKEIVTKTIIGKGKKTFKNEYEVSIDRIPDTVLGCWIINHKIRGKKENDSIKINGSYDINTKTDVINKKTYYEEIVKVRVKDDSHLSDESDVIIRSLENPTCTDVSSKGNIIKYTVIKELGIEIVGDQKIRIPISNLEEEYDVIIDENEINEEIDKQVNENYIKDKEI